MSDIDDFEEPYHDDASDSVGTLRVGKATYAVGLIWQEADDDVDVATAARAVAADTTVNGDFFVLRPQSRQFGIGLRDKGHAKNMPSLGAYLAEVRRGAQASWVGLFAVEGGWYLVAIRDELILAQTDRVFGDEMQARAELDTLLNLDAWGEVFAPAEFEVENSSDKTVEALATGGKAPRLRDIDKMGNLRKWVAAAAVLLLILGGGIYYQNYLNELDIQEQVEAARKLAETTGLAGQQEATVQVPPMPWEGRPVATKYLAACMASMHKATLDFPGWRATKLECDANGAVKLDIVRSAPLESGGGTVNWIRWTLDRSPSLSKASILPTGADGASISWAGEKVDEYGPDINPRAPDIGKTRFYLQSWFEEAFTTIAFPKAAQNEFFRSVTFSFNTGYEPTKFSEILGNVPGLTVDKISVDLNKLPLTYAVEGSIHEQLPLPKNARRAKPAGADARPEAAAAQTQPRT